MDRRIPRRDFAFRRRTQKEEASKLPPLTVKKVKCSVTVIRRRQTANRKPASPFGAVKRGEAPVRRFSCFSVGKASLREGTAGRTACRVREALAPTSDSKCLHLPSVAVTELCSVMADRPVTERISQKSGLWPLF